MRSHISKARKYCPKARLRLNETKRQNCCHLLQSGITANENDPRKANHFININSSNMEKKDDRKLPVPIP